MEEKGIQISYRDLARICERSIPQLRRYALTFFENPEATRRSGVAREFSLTDGFAIYLMGVLVNDYGFTLQEARKHLWKILWNVGRDGPEADLEDLYFLGPEMGLNQVFPVADVLLRIYPGPPPLYEFKVFEEKPTVGDDWKKGTQTRKEESISYWLPKKAMAEDVVIGATLGMIYELPLLAHLKHYFGALRALGF